MSVRIETIVINFKPEGPTLNAVVVSENNGFVGRRALTIEASTLIDELEALVTKSITKAEDDLTVTLERPRTRPLPPAVRERPTIPEEPQ